jgi:putative ABC transport system substrate-binding protein
MGHGHRRHFMIATGALFAAPLLSAQPTGRTYRVAIVLTTSPIAELAGPNPEHPLTRAILHELRDLGYVEGRNLIFERRSAEGDPSRYSQIMDDLIRLNTDAIILSDSPELIRAARAATRTTPLLLMGYARAVEDGFAASLARPGGNITGLAAYPGQEFAAKMLQVFKEAVPGLRRVAFLRSPTAPPELPVQMAEAAAALGIKLLSIHAHPTDPQESFARVAQLRADGVFVSGSSTNFAHRQQLGSLAYAARLPSIGGFAETVEAGGLMSYGEPMNTDRIRRVAHYADKILKGANPGDLPMELPTKFELVINLKTAKALGITIPRSILLRADRLIE